VIENFTKSTKPDGPMLMPYILGGFIAGCVLAGLFITLKVISNKVKAYSSSIYSS
jgi:hypothetical protein